MLLPAEGCNLSPAPSLQVGVATVVGFGVLACILSWQHERRQGGKDTVEFFLTARNSVGAFTIGWSFYAAAMVSLQKCWKRWM